MNKWKQVNIGSIGEVKTGNTPLTSDREYYGGVHPFIKPTDMEIDRRHVTKWEENYSEKAFKKYKNSYIPKGATGVVTIGTVGEKLFQADKPCFTNQSVNVVIPNKEYFDNDFVYYLLKYNLPKVSSANPGTASGRHHVSKSNFCAIKVDVPLDKSIQFKIGRILSAYDDLIENNLKRIKLLEEIAQRTYEEWFVKFRVNGEQLTIDEETGLPVGWEIVKVCDLLDKVKTTIKIPSSEILPEGTIPVIDQSRDFVAGYTSENLSIISISKPIIVFGDHTRVLKFIDFPFARGADGTQLILSKNNRMPQHLFYHSLLNIDLSNYHYARHFKYLKDSEIILPIEKYSNKYEGLVKPIFEKIKVLRFQNVALKQSRDILLPRLMSGTINVES
jgi:type I restriction enzyme S subunit